MKFSLAPPFQNPVHVPAIKSDYLPLSMIYMLFTTKYDCSLLYMIV